MSGGLCVIDCLSAAVATLLLAVVRRRPGAAAGRRLPAPPRLLCGFKPKQIALAPPQFALDTERNPGALAVLPVALTSIEHRERRDAKALHEGSAGFFRRYLPSIFWAGHERRQFLVIPKLAQIDIEGCKHFR